MSPKGPYKLVTVNTSPERAWRLIGIIVEEIKDEYIIQHKANCASKFSFHQALRNKPFLGRAVVSGPLFKTHKAWAPKKRQLTQYSSPTAIDEVEQTVKEIQPDVLVKCTASIIT